MRTHLFFSVPHSALPAVFQVPHSVFGRQALLREDPQAATTAGPCVRTQAATHHSPVTWHSPRALIITGLTILRLGQVLGRRNATAKGRNDYSQRWVFGDIDARNSTIILIPTNNRTSPTAGSGIQILHQLHQHVVEARRPRIVNMLDVNTTSGTTVTPKTAGMESTARARRMAHTSTSNSGVALRTPSTCVMGTLISTATHPTHGCGYGRVHMQCMCSCTCAQAKTRVTLTGALATGWEKEAGAGGMSDEADHGEELVAIIGICRFEQAARKLDDSVVAQILVVLIVVSAPDRILYDEKIRNDAKSTSTGRSVWMATRPAVIKMPRMTTAPAMPHDNTVRCKSTNSTASTRTQAQTQ